MHAAKRRFGAVVAAVAIAATLATTPGVASAGTTTNDASTGVSIPGSLTYLRAKSTPAVGHVAPRDTGGARVSSVKSTFVVTYHGFPANAKASFQRAVDLWSLLVKSSVPIRIDATWTTLDPGVLGGAGPSDFFRDFSGAPRAGTWYPVALANARAGRDLSSGPDIEAVFASNRSDWYLGTDGQTPSGKLDLTSVVLHEIGHGLGITDSTNVAGSLGYWGAGSPYPFAFDRFAQSASGTPISSYASGTSTLGSVLQSNAVRWGGSQGTAADGGSKPHLYSPNPYEPGSSIAHLDEDLYPTGDLDALMTPYLDDGEALHDPGDIVLGMLRDMGWTTTGARGVPAAPSLTTALASNGRAILGWTTPIDTGRQVLTGFRIYRYTGSATSPDATYDVGPTATSTSITGLTNGTPYRFSVAARNASGASAASAKSQVLRPVDLAPFSRPDTLVRQQYADFAGRQPTILELYVWLTALNEGSRSPSATIAAIADSVGNQNRRTTRLYSAYFQRLPDFGGYTYWVAKLNGGRSLKWVSDTFAASSEFRRKYGSLSNTAFVDLVYQNVLGRRADSGGRTYWVGKLNARSMSRGSVMLNFSESSENIRKMGSEVDSVLLRAGMLRRMPTSSEYAADVAYLDGSGDAAGLAATLMALAEYDARVP